eukprot:6277803-Prymnesium_polylepis.2
MAQLTVHCVIAGKKSNASARDSRSSMIKSDGAQQQGEAPWQAPLRRRHALQRRRKPRRKRLFSP